MSFKISQSIEIPPIASVNRTRVSHVLGQLNVNESFFVSSNEMARVSVTSAVKYMQHTTTKRFLTRTVIEPDDNGTESKGVRVWRII